MGENSAISWCSHTYNPWLGCEHVSPACLHCYAETMAAHRWPGEGLWSGTRRPTKTAHQVRAWNRQAAGLPADQRPRVFCASLADVFEDHPDLPGLRDQLWQLVVETPNLDWLLLTKRPQNILGKRMVPDSWRQQFPDHVWVGTTVEDAAPDRLARVDALRQVPAICRFLSCEPLLGPVAHKLDLDGIMWLIVGGESGSPKARPMHPQWALDLRDLAAANGTVFHFKQWGDWAPCARPMLKVDRERCHLLHSGYPGQLHGRPIPRADCTMDYPYGALRSGPDMDLVDRGHAGWVRMMKRGTKATGNLLDGQQYLGIPTPLVVL